jgi:hypothetical protein
LSEVAGLGYSREFCKPVPLFSEGKYSMAESRYFGFYHETRIDIMNEGPDWWPVFKPRNCFASVGNGESVQPLR